MTLSSGIDTSTFNYEIRPQDDLYRHVNGTWLDNHVIPDDRSSDGAFRALRDRSEKDVHTIIEDAAAGRIEDIDSARIGDLYASFMDEDRIETLGAAPLEADLAILAGVVDQASLTKAWAVLTRSGIGGPFAAGVETDPGDPTRYVVWAFQSGIGLPDEAYYREEKHAEILAEYREYLERILTLANVDDAATTAQRAFALEAKLAEHHWDVVRDRDMSLTYNPHNYQEFAELIPSFDLALWIEHLGLTAEQFADLTVQQPSFFTGFDQLWQSEPIENWVAFFTALVVRSRASYLNSALVEENFDFYGRTLSGTPELRERWKRGVSLVEGALGEAVGRVFVSKNFPTENKMRMEILVEHLIAAYRDDIAKLPWMGEETKVEAQTKLSGFKAKIGFPNRWRDYSTLDFDASNLMANVRAVCAFELDYDFSRLGKPVDIEEWEMTPQTVNAYYHPIRNEIVFPAAILRPPFFDINAEDAVNFGGIGAVIGHEIGHGFDDQGSKFDGTGALRDWWTENDRSEFTARAEQLITQYDELVPAQLDQDSELHVNGALTIGENIGDLGGLTIAIKAYERSLDGQESPVIDGFTGMERLFFGWARVWQQKSRDESIKTAIATDPHSPTEFRCNQVAANIDTFADTFGVQEGDGMFLATENRVRIW